MVSLAKQSRIGRLSSTREFFATCKGAPEIPEGGWNFRNFLSDAGRRLIRNIVAVKRSVMLRGIRAITPFLQNYFKEQQERVILGASKRHHEAAASLQTAFQGAIADVFTPEANAALALKVLPLQQSVMAEAAEKVAALAGNARPVSSQAVLSRARGLASRVTGINETTRQRLAIVISQAIEDKLSFDEVCQKIRDEFPSIAGWRVAVIARTEMGKAADAGFIEAIKGNPQIVACSRIGCTAIEVNCPQWHGIKTCQIQNVPVESLDEVIFHPNCNGSWVPSIFRNEDNTVPNYRTEQGEIGNRLPDTQENT